MNKKLIFLIIFSLILVFLVGNNVNSAPKQITVTFIPSQPNVLDEVTVSGRLLDEDFNPMPNQIMNFFTDLGNVYDGDGPNPNQAFTDSNGVARVKLRSTQAGVATVDAWWQNPLNRPENINGRASVTFNPGLPTSVRIVQPSLSYYIARELTYVVKSSIYDVYDNLIKDRAVTQNHYLDSILFTSSTVPIENNSSIPSHFFSFIDTKNPPDGIAEVTLNALEPSITNVQSIYYYSNPILESSIFTIKFSPNSIGPSGQLITVSAIPSNLFVGTNSTIKAFVQTSSGAPAANIPVAFTTSGGTLSTLSNSTTSSGEATSKLTSLSSGTFRVTGTATVQGAVISDFIDVQFVGDISYISIEPKDYNILIGNTLDYQVLAYDSSNSLIGDITTTTTLTSNNSAAARFIDQDTILGESAGVVNINASYAGKTDSTTLTVSNNNQLISITIFPGNTTMNVSNTLIYNVSANYSNGSTVDVTSLATIVVDNTTVATISQNQVIGQSVGTTNVRASYSEGGITKNDITSLTIQGSAVTGGSGGCGDSTITIPEVCDIRALPNNGCPLYASTCSNDCMRCFGTVGTVRTIITRTPCTGKSGERFGNYYELTQRINITNGQLIGSPNNATKQCIVPGNVNIPFFDWINILIVVLLLTGYYLLYPRFKKNKL